MEPVEDEREERSRVGCGVFGFVWDVGEEDHFDEVRNKESEVGPEGFGFLGTRYQGVHCACRLYISIITVLPDYTRLTLTDSVWISSNVSTTPSTSIAWSSSISELSPQQRMKKVTSSCTLAFSLVSSFAVLWYVSTHSSIKGCSATSADKSASASQL